MQTSLILDWIERYNHATIVGQVTAVTDCLLQGAWEWLHDVFMLDSSLFIAERRARRNMRLAQIAFHTHSIDPGYQCYFDHAARIKSRTPGWEQELTSALEQLVRFLNHIGRKASRIRSLRGELTQRFWNSWWPHALLLDVDEAWLGQQRSHPQVFYHDLFKISPEVMYRNLFDYPWHDTPDAVSEWQKPCIRAAPVHGSDAPWRFP
jgi:hypothetical protein